jgi:preprotein translocase subunit YajC
MYWTLAVAESNTPAQNIIKADDINGQQQQQTTTTTQQAAEPNSTTPVKKNPPGYTQLIFIGLIFVILYFMMFRGPKKRQQQQDQMVKALKKNDRVQTIGGIFGTVLDVSDTEITLKIDESNNTKIKVVPSAIHRVINS